MSNLLRQISPKWLEENTAPAIWVDMNTGQWATHTNDESCPPVSGVFSRDTGTFVQRHIEALVENGVVIEEDGDFEPWVAERAGLSLAGIDFALSANEEVKNSITNDRQSARDKKLSSDLAERFKQFGKDGGKW